MSVPAPPPSPPSAPPPLPLAALAPLHAALAPHIDRLPRPHWRTLLHLVLSGASTTELTPHFGGASTALSDAMLALAALPDLTPEVDAHLPRLARAIPLHPRRTATALVRGISGRPTVPLPLVATLLADPHYAHEHADLARLLWKGTIERVSTAPTPDDDHALRAAWAIFVRHDPSRALTLLDSYPDELLTRLGPTRFAPLLASSSRDVRTAAARRLAPPRPR